MPKKLSAKKLATILLAINIYHLVLWTYIGTQKIDFYEDEWFNFRESNHYQNDTYGQFDGQVYLMDDIVKNLFAVGSSHRFDFSIPYDNVVYMGSSHPPLGRMLEHFAYSFVPGVFSNWPGLILNFVALTFTAYSVFFTARTIWRDDIAALFAMATFGTMYGVLNMAVYLYSYCLLMMWAGWLVFWHVREKKNHFLLVLLVVLGGLTHYYFFVLLAMTALCYGIGLIMRKKWGDAWLYVGSMAIAVGLYLIAYPHVFNQFVDKGQRTGQALRQLQAPGFRRALAEYLGELSESICRETSALILSVLAMLVAFAWFYIKHRKIPTEIAQKLLLVAAPALLTLLAIARIAPYITDRYIAVVFPSVGLVFWGLLYQTIKLFMKKWGKLRAALLLSVLLLIGWRRAVYLPYNCYQHMQSQHDMYAAHLPENNNVAVLHIHAGGAYFSIYYHALKDAKYLQFLHYDNLSLFSDFPEEGNIILLVSPEAFNFEEGQGHEVAERLRKISGKNKATFIGYTREERAGKRAEAYLLE
jgi:hypothetical protein